MGLWGDQRPAKKDTHQKPMNGGRSVQEKPFVVSMPLIKSSVPASTSDTNPDIKTTPSEKKLDARNTMNETKSTCDTSPEHKAQNLPNLLPPLEISNLVTSTSMNLIDDVATHLRGLMKGLHGNLPGAEVRAYDPDRVGLACAVASEINKMLRLKLDVIRTGMKIKDKK